MQIAKRLPEARAEIDAYIDDDAAASWGPQLGRNLARWWAGVGPRAYGPAVGTIVVWHSHVGIITGKTDLGWVVKSGSDGHAIRERVRAVSNAIAFRRPS